MERFEYDLTHQVLFSGEMGRLRCIDTIPVAAGDRMYMDANVFVRLSPPRS